MMMGTGGGPQRQHHHHLIMNRSTQKPSIGSSSGHPTSLSTQQLVSDPNDLNSILESLVTFMAESPVTKDLRFSFDYTLTMESPTRAIFKCLVCHARPVLIKLREGGRNPQLSNVGTHLKTVKHRAAQHGFLRLSPTAAAAAIVASSNASDSGRQGQSTNGHSSESDKEGPDSAVMASAVAAVQMLRNEDMDPSRMAAAIQAAVSASALHDKS
jgi:hypothetical protein